MILTGFATKSYSPRPRSESKSAGTGQSSQRVEPLACYLLNGYQKAKIAASKCYGFRAYTNDPYQSSDDAT